MLSKTSRHLSEYFLQIYIAWCFRLFNLNFCRNPPNNTSICATSLVSNFSFFSKIVCLLLLSQRHTFLARQLEAIKWRYVGIRKRDHHVNPAFHLSFLVEMVSLKSHKSEGARYFGENLNCFYVFLGSNTPELKRGKFEYRSRSFQLGLPFPFLLVNCIWLLIVLTYLQEEAPQNLQYFEWAWKALEHCQILACPQHLPAL